MKIFVPQLAKSYDVPEKILNPYTLAERDKVLAKLRGRSLLIDFQKDVDGPQTATRLIRETLGGFGVTWAETIDQAEAVIWIQGGSDPMRFAFVVADTKETGKFIAAECGPRELTETIMRGVCEYFESATDDAQRDDVAELITQVNEINRAITGAFIAQDWPKARKLMNELASAVQRLGSIGDARAVKPVVDALADSAGGYANTGFAEAKALREASIDALARIGRESIPWIKEGLTHSHPAVREACRRALKAGSPEQARRELTEAGMPPVVDRPGYTMHHVGTRTQANISKENTKSPKICKAKTGMPVNNLDSIHKKAAKAGALWRDKDYTEARILYQEIENSISLPLDKAKIMGNIAQLYAEEGNKTNALNTVNAAIKIINDNDLYKSLEGAHLRGYLNGFINRLQDKGTWEPLSYDENIPIELNLNVFDRVRAHFSVAVISGVIFSILSSELNIPSIDISLFHKKIIVFSLAGFLFSVFFTSGILQQSIVTIMAISKRDAKNSLKPAVNLLSVIAALYLIVFSSAFWSMASEIVFFILTGVLGVGIFYGFIYRRHCRRIDE